MVTTESHTDARERKSGSKILLLVGILIVVLGMALFVFIPFLEFGVKKIFNLLHKLDFEEDFDRVGEVRIENGYLIISVTTWQPGYLNHIVSKSKIVDYDLAFRVEAKFEGTCPHNDVIYAPIWSGDGNFNEIDVEFYGHDNLTSVYFSVWRNQGWTKKLFDCSPLPVNFREWHTYAFEVKKDRIYYYVDDVIRGVIKELPINLSSMNLFSSAYIFTGQKTNLPENKMILKSIEVGRYTN